MKVLISHSSATSRIHRKYVSSCLSAGSEDLGWQICFFSPIRLFKFNSLSAQHSLALLSQLSVLDRRSGNYGYSHSKNMPRSSEFVISKDH